MGKKRKSSKSSSYKYKTVNITPVLLKLIVLFICSYCVYCMVFLFSWNIMPYTFGYTLYVVDEDYIEYGVDKGNIILIKNVNEPKKDDIVVRRVGGKYDLVSGVRKSYGIVVSKDVLSDITDVFYKIKNMFSHVIERCLEWIPFSL